MSHAQVRNGHFDGVACAAAPHQRRLRGEFGERFDRPASPAHRIALECVSDAEEEQKERAFGDFAERRRTRGRDEHEEVDLKPALPHTGKGFLHGEERAEEERQAVDHHLGRARRIGEGSQ